MKLTSIGTFLAGVIACAGVLGGGLASAKGQASQATKRVSVKFEQVRVDSAGKKKTVSCTVVTDMYKEASGKETMVTDGVPVYQECSAYPYLQSDRIMLKLHYSSDSQPNNIESCVVDSTITVKSGDTVVVKGAVAKDEKANSESLLFVTATILE